MTVTRMQSAPIQEGHLLASAMGVPNTMVTEKHAVIIVSFPFKIIITN